MAKNNNLAKFMNTAYLRFLQGTGDSRQTVKGFAKHISECSGEKLQDATLRMWMSGERTPSGDWVHVLASSPHIGPEIYDVLGLQRPDPELQQVIRSWGKLPEPIRTMIMKRVRQADARSGEPLGVPVEK